MKHFKVLIVFSIMLITIASCKHGMHNDSNEIMAADQEQLMNEANRQVGMPAIKNYQERKMMKMILELRDQENLLCYAYTVPEMTGKPFFIGKCIGYGLPYATQFTNPQKEIYAGGYQNGFGSLPQADPNGLFMPQSAEGTWLMMVNPQTGKPQPLYCESRVIVSPFPLD